MAIALDSVDAGTVLDNVSSPGTISHVTNGSNRLLLVGFGISSDVATGVTYAGSAMTQLVKGTTTSFGVSYIYGIVAPNTGTNDIVMSWTGATFLRGYGVSYTGVKQSNLPDGTAFRFDSNNVTSIVGTVATNSSPTWAMAVTRSSAAMSAGANQTIRGTSFANLMVGDTNGNITPAQAFPMTTNQTGTSEMSIIMASFADFDQGGARFSLMSKKW